MQGKRTKHHGRIARRLHLLSLGDEAAPKVAEIVDLAVEDDHVPGHRVHHRLGPGGREIENREAAMGEERAPAAGVGLGHPRPGSIGAAVGHRAVHPRDRRAVFLVQPSDDPGDAAHRLGSLKSSGFAAGAERPSDRFALRAGLVRASLQRIRSDLIEPFRASAHFLGRRQVQRVEYRQNAM